MPGTPKPIIQPGFSPHWTTVIQALKFGAVAQSQANAGRNQNNVIDQYGNTTALNGTNLDQSVTIGARWLTQAQVGDLGITPPVWMVPPNNKSEGPVSGVIVGTGLSGSGYAVQQNLTIGSITTVAGRPGATLDHTLSGTFADNQMIGAADVSDPLLGTPVAAIAPGTYIASITGTSITLSQNAVESGASLYCAACVFSQLT